MTALAGTITNEGTVRFRRSAMLLPALVLGNLSVAIHQQSLWMQLGALVTLAVFNATVRERQLVELAWLSEPVETPPKRVYPMHAVLALIAFQFLIGLTGALLGAVEVLSPTAKLAISYTAAAAVVAAVFKTWMSENKLVVMPKRPRGPVLRPIFYGLTISCVAGAAVVLMLTRFGAPNQLPANATSVAAPSAVYDKWFLLGMWVIAAPLFEEWMIRGVLYRSLRRNWSMWVSVAVSAVLFATLHPVAGCVALVTLGTMTALTVEKTGRLWPSIVVHAGYNFMIWALCVM
jgi:ABC-2 type transport system permease protein